MGPQLRGEKTMDRMNPSYKFLAILATEVLFSFSCSVKVNAGVFAAALVPTLSSNRLKYKKFFGWLCLFLAAALGCFMTGSCL
jgi:hypothetical protein